MNCECPMNSHPLITQNETISKIIIDHMYSHKIDDKNLNFDVLFLNNLK